LAIISFASFAEAGQNTLNILPLNLIFLSKAILQCVILKKHKLSNVLAHEEIPGFVCQEFSSGKM